MKENSQLQKIISVLMIFILLIQLLGCVSYKIISSSDLPNSSKYHYKIYSPNSIKFPLENTAIANGILSGKVDFRHSYRRNSIHVYLSSDSVIKINKENILSIPIYSIAKANKSKFAVGKTILLVGGCYLTLGMGAFIIMLTQLKK